MKFSKILFLMISLILLQACGSGSAIVTSPPELPTVTLGDQELDSENSTELTSIPQNIALSFVQAMDNSTVNTDNITISCEENETFSITSDTDTDGIENNEYTLTPANPLPQNNSCSLNLGTGLSTASLSASQGLLQKFDALVSETTSYEFTTPCAATGDPFQEEFKAADSLSDCLSQVRVDGNISFALEQDTDFLTATTESDYDSQDGNQAFFYQAVDFGANFEFVVKVLNFTNLTTPTGVSNSDADGFYITLVDAEGGSNFQIDCGLEKIDTSNLGIFYNATDADGNSMGSGNASLGSGSSLSDIDTEETGSLYIKISGSSQSIDCSYRFGDDGDFTNANTSSLDTTVDSPLSLWAVFAFKHDAGKVSTYMIDELIFQEIND